MNTYYIIQYKHLQFQLLVTFDFGKKTYIILNSEGKECVSVNVTSINSSELHLSMVRFNEHCSLNTKMERGEHTIYMVKALLRFFLEKETFTKISFVDTSTYNCELIDSEESITIPISLTHHNITLYGKTWYERHFNAVVSDTSMRETINTSISKLNSIITRNDIFNRLQKSIQTNIKSTTSTQFQTVLNYVLELLDESFAKSEIWMNFFVKLFSSSGSLATKFGSNFSCSLYYTLDAGVNELFSIPFECESLEMEIAKDTIASYSELVNIQENTNPAHIKMWGGTYKLRKFSKHISMSNYYTNLSLKRKRQRL